MRSTGLGPKQDETDNNEESIPPCSPPDCAGAYARPCAGVRPCAGLLRRVGGGCRNGDRRLLPPARLALGRRTPFGTGCRGRARLCRRAGVGRRRRAPAHRLPHRPGLLLSVRSGLDVPLLRRRDRRGGLLGHEPRAHHDAQHDGGLQHGERHQLQPGARLLLPGDEPRLRERRPGRLLPFADQRHHHPLLPPRSRRAGDGPRHLRLRTRERRCRARVHRGADAGLHVPHARQ